jgi:hypothetical protein
MFGKEGHNCSDIYFDYGTMKQTFYLDDSDLLKVCYDACRAGEKERSTGQDNWEDVMNSWNQHMGSE